MFRDTLVGDWFEWTTQLYSDPFTCTGCGQVLFQGDGTLTGWTVLNQGHNSEYGPLHKIPGCNFSVWADDGKSTPQAYLLATPANYSERNQQLPFDHDACVSADQVHRLRTFPGIKSLTIEGKYPIADVSYDIPGLPVNLSLVSTSYPPPAMTSKATVRSLLT